MTSKYFSTHPRIHRQTDRLHKGRFFSSSCTALHCTARYETIRDDWGVTTTTTNHRSHHSAKERGLGGVGEGKGGGGESQYNTIQYTERNSHSSLFPSLPSFLPSFRPSFRLFQPLSCLIVACSVSSHNALPLRGSKRKRREVQ